MATPKRGNRNSKSSRARKRRLTQKQASAFNFETLEARHLLASVTVGNATDVLSPTADTSSIAALIANDGGDGISLREAVTAANNTFGVDTITFDASIFTGGASSLIRLTQGELEITDTLTIGASAATDVTITGDANGDDVTLAGTFITDVAASGGVLGDNDRVLHFSSSSGDLTLTGLTITGGRTADGEPFDFADSGGGILFSSNGVLTLTSSAVSGNSTGAGGEGTFGPAGGGGDGGGISTSTGTVALIDSTVSGNSTGAGGFSQYVIGGEGGQGGGIFSFSGAVTLTNSTVSGNSTGNGGNSSSGNLGSGGSGGGIFTFSGMVTLTNSTISGNSTGTGGNNNSFYAGDGGGIVSVSGSVSLTNSTVTNNVAAGTSGGILVRPGSPAAPLTIKNSIIAGNTDSGTAPDVSPGSGSSLTINHSLIGDTTGSGIGSSTGTGNILNQPALLGPLTDNGGPTQTHELLPDSPAINTGDPSTTGGTDQRGLARVQFFRVDMGAFEIQNQLPAGGLVVSTTDDIVDDDFSSGQLSLREATLFANEFAGNQTITFDAAVFDGVGENSLIRLTQGQLVITDTLTIDASELADNVTIDAQRSSRVLVFSNPAGDLSLVGLTMTRGRTSGNGGGILFNSDGTLTLTNSALTGNSTGNGAIGFNGDAAGNAANGGGIFTSSGMVSLFNSTVSGNSTGAGGRGYEDSPSGDGATVAAFLHPAESWHSPTALSAATPRELGAELSTMPPVAAATGVAFLHPAVS